MLPSCVSSYGERIQGFSEYRSSTEKFAILRTIRTKESRVKQIEKALNQLTEEEQRLIELRYFDRLPMLRVCFLLAMSETTYKRRRKSALRKIARIMNFI
ncbi:sigma factor-like helix-turn-helix DNA-binding protein [Thermoactinomyces sp. CICC 10520]|uniref:sigma factor-like helix-turn-helix DNA-binding protein n=1 Tax=Thermoactinomyces sp. CICC 10520 TaxID=2767433 RepID=UPI0018DB6600|nr:sigma-70 family RNA polymerase sigma factor [Thermoactinomyces sp. CICC 10520]